MSRNNPPVTDPRRKAEAILRQLRSHASRKNVAGMARYGIRPRLPLGISMKRLRTIAAGLAHNHRVAGFLWSSGVHEARILATILDEPHGVTPAQMDRWIRQVDSWDLCDQCCANLFAKTGHAWKKCREWSRDPDEFTRRAGFSLMARLALEDKKARDPEFIRLLTLIRRGATDNRNFVKKGVNWALRQIGKRNMTLHKEAVALASSLTRDDSPSARWIGKDALRELTSHDVRARVLRRSRA